MQLFAVSCGSDDSLVGAVQDAAGHFPALADGELEHGVSADGGLEFAAIGHAASASGPRRYNASSGDRVVLYDGLPIDRGGGFAAWDAAELLARWRDLPDALDGVFCAVHIDLATGRVECLTDVLGMARVYFTGGSHRWILSNSLAAIRAAARLDEPDALGVSSLLTLGWPACGTTPLAGVRVLPGGHVHELGAHGLRSRPTFTAATAAPRQQRGHPRTAADVARSLATTTASAGRDVTPLVCAVTAGRDTRVLMALARAGGWSGARYYTSGVESDVDVRFARMLTSDLDLPYESGAPPFPQTGDEWRAATARFVAQTDGMATLQGIEDWVDHQRPVQHVGLKLWGAGGEIGRPHDPHGVAVGLVTNTWGLRWFAGPQRWALRRKPCRWDLFRPEALDATRAALDEFASERIDEGWRAREVPEAYYAFERVAHWASSGVRRAASSTDVYSPFLSRDYIQWCFSLSPGERVVEAPHWRLLSELAPDLRDMPFEDPWRPQRPRAAQAMVLLDVARHGRARAQRLVGRSRTPDATRGRYGERWLQYGRTMHRELCLSHDSSRLWEFIDRAALERALSDDRSRDPRHWIGTCNALTAFWWFHGCEAAQRAPVPALG
jgi:hypothetical protein